MFRHYEDLKPFIQKIEPVGSRATVDPPPLDTDIDFLIYSENLHDFLVALSLRGYTLEGDLDKYSPNDNEFFSWRKEDINLIVTEDLEFYDKFMTASNLAKEQNLKNKTDRIKLFQNILYGR